MQATKPHAVLSVPEPVSRKYGQITITASRTVEDAYAINVFVGPERISALCSTTADRNLYRHRYATIRDLAAQGATVEQITAVVTGQGADTVRQAEQVVTATLADLAAHGSHRQVRPTMAGAHLTPLSPAQTRIISAHRDGIVYAGDGARWTVLQSIVRKGYATVNAYQPGGKKISSIRLNKRGLAAVKAVA